MSESKAADEAKDRFKAALEKKRAQQHKSAESSSGEAKIHGTHEAAGGKRTFRRKSGG